MQTDPKHVQQTESLMPRPPQLSKDGKSALQELLKLGSIEQSSKPNIYRTLSTNLPSVNQALAPLDLMAQLDDIRGIVFVAIAPDDTDTRATDIIETDALVDESMTQTTHKDADEEWSHPLVRKQRLTLEQSLLLAILRQRYIEGEQQQGIGANNIIAELDDLQSQLQIYMPTSGSDSSDESRLRKILDQLASHGVVSKIDSNDEVTIRPLIAHVANPENLARLLKQIKTMASNIDKP